MRLSFNLEYSGNCSSILNFYASAFKQAKYSARTFREMETAELLGIKGSGLDMIWQSELRISLGDSVLYLEMADSIPAAMQTWPYPDQPHFNPLINISHDDENEVRLLFERLYGEPEGFESLQNGDRADARGIRWQYQKSCRQGIYYCLTFDGFCRDVIAFYEKVFGIHAQELTRYGDLPHENKLSAAGADMIYSAVLPFRHGGATSALKLMDSPASAADGISRYDPEALLFYQRQFNPLFTLRDSDTVFLADAFRRLADGAKLNRPLQSDEQGNVFGSLIDRYGICWNFYSFTEEGRA